MTSLPFLIMAPTLPILAQWRFRSACALSVAMSLVCAIGAVLSSAALRFGDDAVFLGFSGGHFGYHDTYDVIAHEHDLWSLTLFWAIVMLALYLEARFGTFARKTLLKLTLWGIHLGLLANTSLLTMFATFSMPRRYTDYSDVFAQVERVQGRASFCTSLSVLVLISSILLSFARHLRRS